MKFSFPPHLHVKVLLVLNKQRHKPSSSRHTMTGGMFCLSLPSNLGNVGSEHGVRVIRLCKEDIDLECPESIEQLIEQVCGLPGCSIHCSTEINRA